MAFWVKLKPTDSYLDTELRASGKLISRCLQHGESLKDLLRRKDEIKEFNPNKHSSDLLLDLLSDEEEFCASCHL